MRHGVAKIVFALGVGLLVAISAHRWATDPTPRVERERQETVVAAARAHLLATLALGEIRVVDPLDPDRKVGKSYVYPATDGWEVSGYYRRDSADLWHPFIVTLSHDLALTHLKISDPGLLDRQDDESLLEVLP